MNSTKEKVLVYTHKGIGIYTLKIAVPSEGDFLGYFTKELYNGKQEFNSIDEAVEAIDKG